MNAALPLGKKTLLGGSHIVIGASKSLTNRWLVAEKTVGGIQLQNPAAAEDSQVLIQALTSTDLTVDVHHAGTAMRFLTAYFAALPDSHKILTGSARMRQRPIGILVDALRAMGADIVYLGEEGYPPLEIRGKKLSGGSLTVDAGVSSQYLSALLLAAPLFQQGLRLVASGKVTSQPYVDMTVAVLQAAGVAVERTAETITVMPPTVSNRELTPVIIQIEGDWSSASYFYSMAAVGRQPLRLQRFQQHSLQGDKRVAEIFAQNFSVDTLYHADDSIELLPRTTALPSEIGLDLNDCPDIAQTIAVTAALLKIPFRLIGLHTLKIKETDRLQALQAELRNIGCTAETDAESIRSTDFHQIAPLVSIKTYDDHRMALSFAPCALCFPISIEDPSVVAKSFPDFWQIFQHITTPTD